MSPVEPSDRENLNLLELLAHEMRDSVLPILTLDRSRQLGEVTDAEAARIILPAGRKVVPMIYRCAGSLAALATRLTSLCDELERRYGDDTPPPPA